MKDLVYEEGSHPKNGKMANLALGRKKVEPARGFRTFVNWRAGSEGRIAVLEHRYTLDNWRKTFYGFVEFLYGQVRPPRRAWHCSDCQGLHFTRACHVLGEGFTPGGVNRVFATLLLTESLRLAEAGRRFRPGS